MLEWFLKTFTMYTLVKKDIFFLSPLTSILDEELTWTNDFKMQVKSF